MRAIGQDDFLNGFEGVEIPDYIQQPRMFKFGARLMRSRLEARWAIYFDILHIKWEYEPERIELPGGIRYTPDFWFPERKAWGEVKPRPFTDKEVMKCKLLVQKTGFPCVEFIGKPTVRDLHGWAMSDDTPAAEVLHTWVELHDRSAWTTWEDHNFYKAQVQIAVYQATHDLLQKVHNA